MADVIETPLRLIAELTVSGALAGRYQLEFQRRIEVDGKEIVPPAHMTKDLTPEEGAAILASEAASLAAQVLALSQQIATLQGEVKAAELVAANAMQVVSAIREADKSWDEKVAHLLNPTQETVQS